MATQTLRPANSIASNVLAGGRSSAGPSNKPSMWILDRWRDLLLFVGTPVLLIPLFTAAQARWSAQDIFLFVGAFGAMGHHWHGMMQTYGFCRIYDAKASGKAAARARIDMALCFAWFLGAEILSPMRFRTC